MGSLMMLSRRSASRYGLFKGFVFDLVELAGLRLFQLYSFASIGKIVIEVYCHVCYRATHVLDPLGG